MWGTGSRGCRRASGSLLAPVAAGLVRPTQVALSRRSILGGRTDLAFARAPAAAAAPAAGGRWSSARRYSDTAGPAAPVPAPCTNPERIIIERPSVDPAEVARFAAVADQWWDPYGTYAKLQLLNQARISFIRRTVELHAGLVPKTPSPLAGLSIIDVGCGGGLLAEPLARLGADVTGIDATGESIHVARAHAEQDRSVAARLRYRHCTLEDVLQEGATHDVVIASEVVEHVTDPGQFVAECCAAVAPGGLLFLSTLNRTTASYALAILMAENVLGWVPPGTHSHEKFLRPAELVQMVEHAGLAVDDIKGMSFTPFASGFRLSDNTEINYILAASRPVDADAADT